MLAIWFAGARMLGVIDCGGIGQARETVEVQDQGSLRQGRCTQNEALIRSNRCDVHAEWLVEHMQKEARLGRMTCPVEARDSEANGCLLHPRFSVEQTKPDGSLKKRPIDNFSFSVGGDGKAGSVNGHAQPEEQLKHDSVDCLAETLKVFKSELCEVPGLLKADIDNAFRRLPIFPGHRWACGVAVRMGSKVLASQHIACPLGAVASVVAWERIGAALTHLGRELLKVALLRYVDDYFAPDRLVTVILGPGAINPSKVECSGEQLCILGLDVNVSARGFRFTPSKLKVKKYCEIIDEILCRGRLEPGLASKMSGRLSWSCSNMFHKVGRATLRPLFDQKTRRDGQMSDELKESLSFWRTVLAEGISELREWREHAGEIVHLFVDAAGSPACLGAVLFLSHNSKLFTHMRPTELMMRSFMVREDKQIMGLELLAISVALSTFAPWLVGKRIVIHSDNSGAEVRISVCSVNDS
eukprot:10853323-Karenia_brevis.AAC.1